MPLIINILLKIYYSKTNATNIISICLLQKKRRRNMHNFHIFVINVRIIEKSL